MKQPMSWRRPFLSFFLSLSLSFIFSIADTWHGDLWSEETIVSMFLPAENLMFLPDIFSRLMVICLSASRTFLCTETRYSQALVFCFLCFPDD